MDEGQFQFLDLILLAMIAGFILLRLRSVLGRRTGNEKQAPNPYSSQDQSRDKKGEKEGDQNNSQDDNVIQLPNRGDETIGLSDEELTQLWADDSPVGAGLTQVKIADHSFDPAGFVDGSRMAYEMIVDAFAKADRDTLGTLLSDEVYENFDTAISAREAEGHTLETSIADIQSVDIVEARMTGSIAEITVKVVAETVSATKDQDGEIVDGSGVHSRVLTDIWTFARDTRSQDPNWLLIETRSQN
jgi:predicted lipid-binding transport protein (Tim44 family)